MLCTDVYSTVYPCEAVVSDIRAGEFRNDCAESFRHSAKIAEGDDVPQTIYAMWCTSEKYQFAQGRRWQDCRDKRYANLLNGG